jgi:hypothetical protein
MKMLNTDQIYLFFALRRLPMREMLHPFYGNIEV